METSNAPARYLMLTLRTVLAGSLVFVTTAGAQTPSLPSGMQPDTTVSELKSPTKARLLGDVAFT